VAIEVIRTQSMPDEHETQSLLFHWMRLTPVPWIPGAKIADYAWMNPNGLYLGGGTPVQKAAYISKMKRAGFTPGVADVTIALPVLDMHGAYLELKRGMTPAATRRALSEDQIEHLCRMYNVGYFAGVAAGFDHALEAVKHYMNGGRSYNIDLFAELDEDGVASPLQPKRKRSTTNKPKA
jgi:hypothetical protein